MEVVLLGYGTVSYKGKELAMTTIPKDPAGVAMYERIFGRPEPKDKPLSGVREFSVNHLFANVWSRGGLSLRDRRLITIALLAAQGRPDQLKAHLRGARLGEEPLSEAEIMELLIHVAHYGGWAAGAGGQGIAQSVFDELAQDDS
jgi:4-carboxymuconolactone decarboxylase